MDKRMLARISRLAGVPDLVDVLAERLSPTDLQSLLLEVYRRRAAKLTPARLLERHEQNRFVRPSEADPGALADFERLAVAQLPAGYEQIELAPVAPLGTIGSLTGLSQDWAVSTIRNTEVVSDSTNVLALECASRRRRNRHEAVRLCASHRLLRTRIMPAGFFQHFRLFGLCTAGRDIGSLGLESEALAEHISFHLRVLTESGLDVRRTRVTLAEPDGTGMLTRLQGAVFEPLSLRFPDVAFGPDPDPRSGRGYYVGVRFQIYATDRNGAEAHVADGGFTTWTQALLSDRKERLLTSAIGSERVCGLFWPRNKECCAMVRAWPSPSRRR